MWVLDVLLQILYPESIALGVGVNSEMNIYAITPDATLPVIRCPTT